MALNKERIEEIESITWDLIWDTYKDKNVVPPIDVRHVADSVGLKIEFGFFEDEEVDGAFDRDSGKIFINSKISPERQLFTIAHELGHFILHKDTSQERFYRRDRFKFNDEKLPEQEANWFAASLLMPIPLIKHYYDLYESSGGLSYAFMTSHSATTWRLKHLGYK
jgi:Zn-dependent peptidase ImmA (M78 family)